MTFMSIRHGASNKKIVCVKPLLELNETQESVIGAQPAPPTQDFLGAVILIL